MVNGQFVIVLVIFRSRIVVTKIELSSQVSQKERKWLVSSIKQLGWI